MAQANLRLAAGVGAVAACLLVGGASAAVAVADPGGGHSGHSGSGNGNGKGSNNGANQGSRSGSNFGDTNVNSDNASASRRPSSKFGSGRDVGASAQRRSSDYSPGSPHFKTPKVTVGDGRTPDVQDHDSSPGWQGPGPAPAPAPPPPPQVITVPLNPPTIKPIREQHGVVEQLVTEPTGGLAGPLWGVAGLVLIPAAGAILGYRQARAAQSAAELGRHP
ncbi:MAG: hypothetical protein NVS4B6_25410 [Mycobacterium sp.]